MKPFPSTQELEGPEMSKYVTALTRRVDAQEKPKFICSAIFLFITSPIGSV